MLYLCNNQTLLKAVKKWIGEGRKETLIGALDADHSSLREAIEDFLKTRTAGATKFLVKVYILISRALLC